MSKSSVRSFVFAALLVVVFAAAMPVHAAALNDGSKPACTVKSNWFERTFHFCVNVDQQAPVSMPTVVAVDTAKWVQALNNAEAALRAASNGNNDPVDSSNVVKDAAWKVYCNSQSTPTYTVTGDPVCK